MNINNQSINTYEFKGSIKLIYTNDEKIAVNTGSEIHFIGLNGWLIKKYTSLFMQVLLFSYTMSWKKKF